MKTGLSLEEMAKELDRQNKVKRDFVAPTSALKMEVEVPPQIHDEKPVANVRLQVNGHGTFDINRNAHQQLAQRLQIPSKYYDRMQAEAPHLLATNVNEWFGLKPEKRMVRTLDGNARAFLSNRYRPLDNFDLSQVAFDTLSHVDGLKLVSQNLTEDYLYIKAMTEKITFEIKKGDIVQAGIVITNSEVGRGSIKVEPLIYRLVCSNGLISADSSMRRSHIGRERDVELAEELNQDETKRLDDKAFWMKARDVIAGSFRRDIFEKIANRMIETTKNSITGDPVKVVEVVQAQFMLRDDERSGILQHLIKGGDLTQYGLINAITRQSQDVSDYDRATDLERLGGEVLELPQTDWHKIAVAA
jgi:hypothetical protein